MNPRIHWAAGAAILATAVVLPTLLWWAGFASTAWTILVFIAVGWVVTLVVVLVGGANAACDRAMLHEGPADAGEAQEIPPDVYCPACSYSLQGAPSSKCPECGRSLANIRTGTHQIPWVRRREIGRFLGYWSTVWMVTFRNRRFCEEYAHKVAVGDAVAFQRVTVLHVYVLVLLATLGLYMTIPTSTPQTNPALQMMTTGVIAPGPSLIWQAYADIWPVGVMHVFLMLYLIAITGVPSYFFHPRSVAVQQQNNAVAMSYYACGPLAAAPFLGPAVFMLIGFPLAVLTGTSQSWVGVAVLASGGIVTAVWWWNLVRLIRRVMPQLSHRAIAIAAGMPALWLGLAALFLCVLPSVVLYLLAVVVSLGA